MDKQLETNKYLAGPELTAADVMTLYTVTTQRYWGPQLDLTPYKNILRWVQVRSMSITLLRHIVRQQDVGLFLT